MNKKKIEKHFPLFAMNFFVFYCVSEGCCKDEKKLRQYNPVTRYQYKEKFQTQNSLGRRCKEGGEWKGGGWHELKCLHYHEHNQNAPLLFFASFSLNGARGKFSLEEWKMLKVKIFPLLLHRLIPPFMSTPFFEIFIFVDFFCCMWYRLIRLISSSVRKINIYWLVL